MEIDINQVLKDFDGNSLINEGKELTLKKVMIESLLLPLVDIKLSGEEKVKRAIMAQQIHVAKDKIDLKIEDIAIIKNLIGIHCLPLIVLGAWKMLEKE